MRFVQFSRLWPAIATATLLAGCSSPDMMASGSPNFSSSGSTPSTYAVPAAPSKRIAPATINGKVVPSYGSNYNPANGSTNGE